jgi:hypothetical protein
MSQNCPTEDVLNEKAVSRFIVAATATTEQRFHRPMMLYVAAGDQLVVAPNPR